MGAFKSKSPFQDAAPEVIYNLLQKFSQLFVVVDSRDFEDFLESHLDYSIMFSEDTFQQDLEKAFATINGEFQFTLIVVGDAKPVQRALRRVRWKRFSPKQLYVLRDYTDFRDRFSWMATDSSFYAAGGCFPSWVLPNLYISNWGVAKDVSVHEAMGITHVINCTPELPFAKKGGQTHMRVPVVDTSEQDIYKHLLPACEFLDQAINISNGTVLVHCKHGQSRSAAIILAFLIFNGTCDNLDSAFEFLRKRRSCIKRGTFQQQVKRFENDCLEATFPNPV